VNKIRSWAHAMRREAHAVYLAARDPRVSLLPKILGLVITAYAMSPIDLIPDFVPILGYVDDLLIVPLGLWITVKLIPEEIMHEHRLTAEAATHQPISRTGAVLVVLLWVMALGSLLTSVYLYRYW